MKPHRGRAHVWGPGDHGVDEILVYYDAADNAWWCLADLTGDLVALCDLNGTSDTARVVAQWTYDAYGSVMSADHIHSFERPNLGHKGLFLDRLDLANPLGPQLVPFAQSVYHNRNRAYIPQLGRFLQQDPNNSAISLIAASPFHGRGAGAIAVAFDLDSLYGDGANLYQYLGSNPWMRNDPTGLSWDPFSMVDEYLAEDAASKAAFLGAVGMKAKATAIVGATILSLFPGVGAVGELALAALQGTPLPEATVAIVAGAIGGKLLGTLVKFTYKVGQKAFVAAKHYASKSGFARRNLEHGNDLLAAGAGGGRMAEVRRLGLQGEDAVRAIFDIGPKKRISVNGRTRIPDGIREDVRVLTEIKNAQSLSYTQQLRDYVDYARANSFTVDLYVRQTTTLSGPLGQAIRSGRINLRFIPE